LENDPTQLNRIAQIGSPIGRPSKTKTGRRGYLEHDPEKLDLGL
jgi:hypothetical protein